MGFSEFQFVLVAFCQNTPEKSFASFLLPLLGYWNIRSPLPPSLFFLSLTNFTSLSLSLYVRCSSSLQVIFAALGWFHSRKQAVCYPFSIVGGSDSWSFRDLRKIKALFSLFSLMLSSVLTSHTSFTWWHTYPAVHTTCRQVPATSVRGWRPAQINPLPRALCGWDIQCDGGSCSSGCALCHQRCQASALLFWGELLALSDIPCCWLAAVPNAGSGCPSCAVGLCSRPATITWGV